MSVRETGRATMDRKNAAKTMHQNSASLLFNIYPKRNQYNDCFKYRIRSNAAETVG